MPAIFEDGLFAPHVVRDERTERVLVAAANRGGERVTPSDFLAAAIDSADARVLASLQTLLEPGAHPRDLKELIEVYNPPARAAAFDGRRERFSPEALAALDELEQGLSEDAGDRSAYGLELLLAAVLAHPDPEDRATLTILDLARGPQVFHEQANAVRQPLTPLFDSESGRLRSEEFAESAWTVLEYAAARAAEWGYDRVLPPHVFVGALGETEGLAEHLVRLQAQPEIGPGKVAEIVASTFRLGERRGDGVELTRDGVAEAALALLRSAQRTARTWGAERIETAHLIAALLEDMPARLAMVLQRSPLNLDLERMRGHLAQTLRESRSRVKREVAFRLPASLLPSEDLTFRARTDGLKPGLHLDAYFDPLCRALYRRANNHVLITGLKGVGKTSLVRELARRAAAGEIPFLARKRFVWVDCAHVAPGDSAQKLTGLLGHVSGRTDLVVCVDGLGPLLRGESGSTHKLLLRAALKERRVHLAAVMSNRDFEDLLSADHELSEFFTRVEVLEPGKDAARGMVQQAADELAASFHVTIEERAVERAVVLSADYILNERLPTKAIKILGRVCEDLDFERTQKQGTRSTVAPADVIHVVSEVSGVPEGTLSGISENADYRGDLGNLVIGQDQAVASVAEALELIKAGLSSPGKPASVMFFAGLTGCGKTELAKALARFYSASKKLQTYTMGNFTEAHTISGIIGVPPGYVGHEQGGRLINDLNSDPYCVFLLDEAEKAHPDIWKPFLNLFDEAWITDQRGTKAFGDRAIFILTSNAGADVITRMSQAGEPMERIVDGVKAALSEIRSERSSQAVFSPEFLARIQRIIVFKPLDEAAMEGICRKQLARMQDDWLRKREKTIVIPEALVKHVAAVSHAENVKSGGKEGGRIVAKKISEIIEVGIQNEAKQRQDEFKKCQRVEIEFLPPPPPLPGQPRLSAKLHVRFVKPAETPA